MFQNKLLAVAWSVVGFSVGIISVLMGTNSYMSQIKEEKFEILSAKQELQQLIQEQRHVAEQSKLELQRLSTEAYSTFNSQQDQLLYKLTFLERYVEEHQKVEVYYEQLEHNQTDMLSSDTEILEKLKLANSRDDKAFVLKSVWNENRYIGELAEDVLLNLVSDEDAYTVVKYITTDNVRYYMKQSDMIESWVKQIEKNQWTIFEDAITRVVVNYKVSDTKMSYLFSDIFEAIERSPESQASLKRLVTLFEKHDLKYSYNDAKALYFAREEVSNK